MALGMPLMPGRAGDAKARRRSRHLVARHSDTIVADGSAPSISTIRLDDMLTALYYLLMLLVGVFWYRYGQKLLRQGLRDENDELTKPPVGPVGFVVISGVAAYLLFAALRALVLREIPCVGKGCAGQIYTLAEHAGQYWANLFFVVWLVLALGYAMYVTLKIWFRQ
jgi:hypothetical protein